MATSVVSQSPQAHTSVNPSTGDASHLVSSILTAAGKLEAVIDKALPEGAAQTNRDPVTRNTPALDPSRDPLVSASPATPVAQQPAATSAESNQLQVTALVHADNTASLSATSALPVSGLTEMSADEDESIVDSGVAPTPDL